VWPGVGITSRSGSGARRAGALEHALDPAQARRESPGGTRGCGRMLRELVLVRDASSLAEEQPLHAAQRLGRLTSGAAKRGAVHEPLPSGRTSGTGGARADSAWSRSGTCRSRPRGSASTRARRGLRAGPARGHRRLQVVVRRVAELLAVGRAGAPWARGAARCRRQRASGRRRDCPPTLSKKVSGFSSGRCAGDAGGIDVEDYALHVLGAAGLARAMGRKMALLDPQGASSCSGSTLSASRAADVSAPGRCPGGKATAAP
jgi:hypothetical protein